MNSCASKSLRTPGSPLTSPGGVSSPILQLCAAASCWKVCGEGPARAAFPQIFKPLCSEFRLDTSYDTWTYSIRNKNKKKLLMNATDCLTFVKPFFIGTLGRGLQSPCSTVNLEWHVGCHESHSYSKNHCQIASGPQSEGVKVSPPRITEM